MMNTQTKCTVGATHRFEHVRVSVGGERLGQFIRLLTLRCIRCGHVREIKSAAQA